MTKPKVRRPTKTVIQLLLFIAIISGGLVFAKYFIDTKPTAHRSRPTRQVPLVDIIPARITNKTVVINAMGTVVPSRQISLYSQLSGTVDWISDSFSPGGRVFKGEELVRLDKEDYELEVKKQQTLVRQLQADLDLEKGKQEVAKQEIELMKRTTGRTIKDPTLALRIPQMEKALATLKSQQIGLEQAQLNLKRTLVVAPFNALVLDRSIELGSRVSTSNALATLIGTDAFWIEASLPIGKLQWISIPGQNGKESSRVRVHLQDGSTTEGSAKRLLGDLTGKSQMARILVQVDDPLGMGIRQGQMPLLVNSYVSMDFIGSMIEEVVEIPRKMVKDGNQIWLFEDEQLKIRTINPIWEDEEYYYVRNNVRPGELLITSEMSAAVDGMSVRTQITELAKNEKTQMKGNKRQGAGDQSNKKQDSK